MRGQIQGSGSPGGLAASFRMAVGPVGVLIRCPVLVSLLHRGFPTRAQHMHTQAEHREG